MPENDKRIAVTGTGLVCPAGLNVSSSWDFVLSGKSSARKCKQLKGLENDYACSIVDFDPDKALGRSLARRIDRFIQFALVAYREAVAEAGLDPEKWNGRRVGVVVGNSLAGIERFLAEQQVLESEGNRMVSPSTIPGAMINMAAGQIAIDCHATGPSLLVSTACASGITAIDTACQWLKEGRCDVVIAGATEAPIVPLIASGMNRLGALSKNPDIKHASRPFDQDRDGFVIAEGAGFVVLETEEHAISRGQEILAFISGAGTSTDAYHVTTPEPQGRGLSAAIQQAMEKAGLEGKDIQYVNAHGTSTRLNDVTEGKVIEKEIGQHAFVTSLKGAIGHTLAAAGAVETVLTILSVKHGLIPPTANLISLDPEIKLNVVYGKPRKLKIRHALKLSMGFGGHNGALIISSNNMG
ncbi:MULTISPECIES: beta-ketoacyl-[acyl-carrier-protein] synthase family protein [Pantoea]|uniref:beta-ketoacyl-[acyl-carrier-protein] synthase family protein n=1 Tax=Pantoea TaxID=53335 RepID=UPI0028933B83|nr:MULTISPECIES: beta-ketoacyl-[acyl-carrier-protein] synthase family protein [unclassified Pantoea]MCG7388447.1 beta-ketoacyl-[acyl-carrier-protein] synthase family protein [Pantoea sp. ACRSB]